MEDILRIFDIDKKSTLKKYCRDLTITGSEFVNLIYACESKSFPYRHRSYAVDFHQDHLEPTEQERAAFKSAEVGSLDGDAGKFVNKMIQRFKDRRCITGHIFHTNCQSRWHFFYFDQRDFKSSENHWVRGTHLHLINYLWPNLTLSSVLDNFSGQKVVFNSSIHIKCDEPRMEST